MAYTIRVVDPSEKAFHFKRLGTLYGLYEGEELIFCVDVLVTGFIGEHYTKVTRRNQGCMGQLLDYASQQEGKLSIIDTENLDPAMRSACLGHGVRTIQF